MLQFLLTDSQKQLDKNKTENKTSDPDKVVQCIVEMKKSAFKEEDAKCE